MRLRIAAPAFGKTESDAITGSSAIFSSTRRSCISRPISLLTAKRLAQTSMPDCSFLKPKQAVRDTKYIATAKAKPIRFGIDILS